MLCLIEAGDINRSLFLKSVITYIPRPFKKFVTFHATELWPFTMLWWGKQDLWSYINTGLNESQLCRLITVLLNHFMPQFLYLKMETMIFDLLENFVTYWYLAYFNFLNKICWDQMHMCSEYSYVYIYVCIYIYIYI